MWLAVFIAGSPHVRDQLITSSHKSSTALSFIMIVFLRVWFVCVFAWVNFVLWSRTAFIHCDELLVQHFIPTTSPHLTITSQDVILWKHRAQCFPLRSGTKYDQLSCHSSSYLNWGITGIVCIQYKLKKNKKIYLYWKCKIPALRVLRIVFIFQVLYHVLIQLLLFISKYHPPSLSVSLSVLGCGSPMQRTCGSLLSSPRTTKMAMPPCSSCWKMERWGSLKYLCFIQALLGCYNFQSRQSKCESKCGNNMDATTNLCFIWLTGFVPVSSKVDL